MSTLQVSGERHTRGDGPSRRLLGDQPVAMLGGLGAAALFVVWAAHDGGYDSDTWYWGALAVLSVLTFVLLRGGWTRLAQRASLRRGAIALAAYVAFSYLSILWAGSPGDALTGSNRALLYLELFLLMAALPWTAHAARTVLIGYAVAIGVLAFVMLTRLASADHLDSMIAGGRLNPPTGYFNSTAALFFGASLVSTALAADRRLAAPLRGLLIAVATAELQLTLVAQSRGWLFTLPLVLLVGGVVLRGRLRALAVALLPAGVAILSIHRLLAIYNAQTTAQIAHAATHTGRVALAVCFGCFVLATILAWGDQLAPVRPSQRTVRWIGAGVAVVVLAVGVAGVFTATHGDPGGFVSRQWRGFSHPPSAAGSGSHFATVGSGRYDIWRVALDAFAAHPIGGLGQDNYADYYLPRRHSDEEPSWTHSLELRMLTHTGLVGAALFLVWLGLALRAALGVRRRGDPVPAALAGIALLPLAVWVIHGSVDWFWEVPALSGPAIGFLAMAGALGADPTAIGRGARRWAPPRWLSTGAGAVVLCAAVVALAFPFLAVRYTSRATDEQARNPIAALSDLHTAADLNPLDSGPSRLAGAIALRNGLPNVAQDRFAQAINREAGGWFNWFGAGLAASTLGDATGARRDLTRAESINAQQPVVRRALAQVGTPHPLTPAQAFALLSLVR